MPQSIIRQRVVYGPPHVKPLTCRGRLKITQRELILIMEHREGNMVIVIQVRTP